jgi:hypothetical protein
MQEIYLGSSMSLGILKLLIRRLTPRANGPFLKASEGQWCPLVERQMKPCKFTFDDTPAFDGFAHGSTWNGFDNVAVTPAVRDQIVAYFKKEYGEEYQEAFGDDFEQCEIGADGLISLGWKFATQIVEDKKL